MTDLHWRTLGRADLLACERICARAADADGAVTLDGAGLAEWFARPGVQPERDSLAAVDSRGEVVAFGLVAGRSSAGASYWLMLDGATDPAYRRRGLGRRVLAWQERRARELHLARFPQVPGLLVTWAPEQCVSAIRLFERAGLTPVRWLHHMELPLTGCLPARSHRSPDHVRLLRFDPTRHSAPTYDAHNDAFRDELEFAPWTPEYWRSRTDESTGFRPDLSYVALRTNGEVAAYVLSYAHGSQLELAHIGTRPAYRGRGLASAVIAEVLRAAAEEGYETAALIVDSANPTGAMGVYERLGFVAHTRVVRHGRRFPATTVQCGAHAAGDYRVRSCTDIG